MSPTWELELLISGAVLVALFQLPPIISGVFNRLEPHTATRNAGTALFFVTFYSKLMVFALIASFVVHLAARAYWVGLIGLQSVFPNGIQWDRVKQGPIAKGFYRERFSSIPNTIARLDNFCSVIFSFAFLIVLFFALSILMMGTVAGLAYGIALVAFGGRHASVLLWTLIALLTIVPVAAATLDRYAASRIAPDGRTARVLRGMFRVLYRTQLMNLYGPIMMTLITNVKQRIMYTLMFVAFFGLIAFGVFDILVQQGLLTVNGYDYFVETEAHAVQYRYYESQRPTGEIFERVPSIQSDIITDGYIRLFIPYSPERHNAALAANCAGLRPLRPRGLQLATPVGSRAIDSAATIALHCLTTMHAVTLNGRPLEGLEFNFHTNPETGLKGIVTYISTTGLPKGKNTLTIEPAPRPPASTTRTPLRPFVIPFWI